MGGRRQIGHHRRFARIGAALLASLALLCLATLAVQTSAAQVQVPSDPTRPTVPSLPGGGDPDPPAGDPSSGDPSGSDPPASDPPSAPSGPSAKRLSPFPFVTLSGREAGRVTRVQELIVEGRNGTRGPEGAVVRVRCLGARCPIRRTGGTIGDEGRLRLRKAERRYRAGNALVIRVLDEEEERIGKYTRIRFRRGLTPTRMDACLQPGESDPSPCP